MPYTRWQVRLTGVALSYDKGKNPSRAFYPSLMAVTVVISDISGHLRASAARDK